MRTFLVGVLVAPLVVVFVVIGVVSSVRMSRSIGRARTVAEVDRAVAVNRLTLWPLAGFVLTVALLVGRMQ